MYEWLDYSKPHWPIKDGVFTIPVTCINHDFIFPVRPFFIRLSRVLMDIFRPILRILSISQGKCNNSDLGKAIF